MEKIQTKYSDIIKYDHPVSKKHPQMSLQDRAAQFAPFAALRGHHEAMKETARLTQSKKELSEEEKEKLDRILAELIRSSKEKRRVSITYFEKDLRKEGGHYRTILGQIKTIDEIGRRLVLENKMCIAIQDICELKSIEEQSDTGK